VASTPEDDDLPLLSARLPRVRRAMARRACALDAYDRADRPLIADAPHLLASFAHWLRSSDLPPIRGLAARGAPPPPEPPEPEPEPEHHETSAASAYQRTWHEEYALPYLSFSEDDELAGDAARWQATDAEDEAECDFCCSCSICGSPSRSIHHVRYGYGWVVCCAACARFMYRPSVEFDESIGSNGEPPSDVTWDFDFEHIQRRLNSPPWTPGQRHR